MPSVEAIAGLAKKMGGYDPRLDSADVIERQLAHCERNKVRAAYNHAQYLPERRKMMQWWADYLDKARGKANRGKKKSAI